MDCGDTRNDHFQVNSGNNLKLKKDYEEKLPTGKEIQIQNWGGNRQLSMEGTDIKYFPNSVYPGSNVTKS